MLWAVLSAADILNVGFVGVANEGLTGILTIDLDHGLSLLTFSNLANSIDQFFSLNHTLLGDTGVSLSDFSLGANDSDALSVLEVLTLSAWLSDTLLLLQVVVFDKLTDRNTVSSLDLVSWFAGGLFTNLSVPSAVGTASIDASSTDELHLWWTGLLDAMTVLLGVTFLAFELEAGTLDEGVTLGTTDSSALSSNKLEVLWTVNFITSGSSSDLSGWAGDLVADILSSDEFLLVSCWALDIVANTVFLDLARLALLSLNFFSLVASLSDQLVSV